MTLVVYLLLGTVPNICFGQWLLNAQSLVVLLYSPWTITIEILLLPTYDGRAKKCSDLVMC